MTDPTLPDDHPAPVSETLAAVLRSERVAFNIRFAETRHRLPGLDGEAFSDFLRQHIDPLAQAVARHRPERVPEVVHAAYDLGLELVGRRLAGPGSAIADGGRCGAPPRRDGSGRRGMPDGSVPMVMRAGSRGASASAPCNSSRRRT